MLCVFNHSSQLLSSEFICEVNFLILLVDKNFFVLFNVYNTYMCVYGFANVETFITATSVVAVVVLIDALSICRYVH